MTKLDQQKNAFETSGTSPPVAHAENTENKKSEMTAEERKQNRSTGLRIFDILLYPLLNNFIVMGISIAATYLTTKGNVQGGAIGKFFYTRGKMATDFLQRRGMSEESASFAKMVFFSFFDGIFLTPIVKLAEDRRERIGKWIDDTLGTTPINLAVYESEPKQTWGSVLKGRIATGLIVLPTAVIFDKTGVNDKLFTGVGNSIANFIAKHQKIAAKFGRTDIGEISKIGVFELVYTSICTAGLYITSRIFARNNDVKTGRVERDPESKRIIVHSHDEVQQGTQQPREEIPSRTVSHATAHTRLAPTPAMDAALQA